MPAMPRWNKKAEKIAYDILGAPENRSNEPSRRRKKIKKELIEEEGQWTR
jgi:hypothetical protein